MQPYRALIASCAGWSYFIALPTHLPATFLLLLLLVFHKCTSLREARITSVYVFANSVVVNIFFNLLPLLLPFLPLYFFHRLFIAPPSTSDTPPPLVCQLVCDFLNPSSPFVCLSACLSAFPRLPLSPLCLGPWAGLVKEWGREGEVALLRLGPDAGIKR